MKRVIALILALVLLPASAFAETAFEKLNNMYMEASLLLVEGRYEEAAKEFDRLSGYSDAAQMAIYCRCIVLAEKGEYQSASDSLKKLGSFKDAAIMADYYKACQLMEQARSISEDETDLQKLREAISSCDNAVKAFRQIIVYKDSAAKAEESERMMKDVQAKYDKQYAYEKMHRYKSIGACVNGAVSVENSNGKYGMVFSDGSEYIECEYEYMSSYSEGWIAVQKNYETMFIDKEENVVLDNDMLSTSSANLITSARYNDSVIASYNGQYCFVDTSGYVITAARENYVEDLRDWKQDDRVKITVMPGRGGTYYMLCDIYGYTVSDIQYDSLSFLGEGLAFGKKGNCGYLINMNGETVAVFDKNVTVYDYSDGLARVRNENGMYGFIDTKGKTVIPFEYESAEDSGDQLIYTNIGWINHENQVVIPSNGGLSSTKFQNGYALVYSYVTGVSSLIDKNGELVMRPDSSNYNLFKDDYVISINDRFGYVDIYNTKGELIYRNPQKANVVYKYEDSFASWSAQFYGDYQSGRNMEITVGGGYLYVLDDGWLSIYDVNGEKVF